MLYNGEEPFPDKKVLRLSDAFPMEGDAELIVTAYNITYSEQNKILQECRPLHGYSLFVHRVQENKVQGMALEQGILKAIKDCRADGTMADFLERHHGEVFGMVSLQWDEEKAKEFYESEARAEGIDFAIVNSIRNLMKNMKLSAQQAMDVLEIPVTDQKRYAALI